MEHDEVGEAAKMETEVVEKVETVTRPLQTDESNSDQTSDTTKSEYVAACDVSKVDNQIKVNPLPDSIENTLVVCQNSKPLEQAPLTEGAYSRNQIKTEEEVVKTELLHDMDIDVAPNLGSDHRRSSTHENNAVHVLAQGCESPETANIVTVATFSDTDIAGNDRSLQQFTRSFPKQHERQPCVKVQTILETSKTRTPQNVEMPDSTYSTSVELEKLGLPVDNDVEEFRVELNQSDDSSNESVDEPNELNRTFDPSAESPKEPNKISEQYAMNEALEYDDFSQDTQPQPVESQFHQQQRLYEHQQHASLQQRHQAILVQQQLLDLQKQHIDMGAAVCIPSVLPEMNSGYIPYSVSVLRLQQGNDFPTLTANSNYTTSSRFVSGNLMQGNTLPPPVAQLRPPLPVVPPDRYALPRVPEMKMESGKLMVKLEPVDKVEENAGNDSGSPETSCVILPDSVEALNSAGPSRDPRPTRHETHEWMICPICGLMIRDNDMNCLAEHVRDCVIANFKDTDGTCPLCLVLPFSRTEDLVQHIITDHVKAKIVKTASPSNLKVSCERSVLMRRQTMARKKRIALKLYSYNESMRMHECSSCGRYFRLKSILFKHINDGCSGIRQDNTVSCLCGKAFITCPSTVRQAKARLMRHVGSCDAYLKAPEEERKYIEEYLPALRVRCECGTWRANMRRLKTHMRGCDYFTGWKGKSMDNGETINERNTKEVGGAKEDRAKSEDEQGADSWETSKNDRTSEAKDEMTTISVKSDPEHSTSSKSVPKNHSRLICALCDMEWYRAETEDAVVAEHVKDCVRKHVLVVEGWRTCPLCSYRTRGLNFVVHVLDFHMYIKDAQRFSRRVVKPFVPFRKVNEYTFRDSARNLGPGVYAEREQRNLLMNKQITESEMAQKQIEKRRMEEWKVQERRRNKIFLKKQPSERTFGGKKPRSSHGRRISRRKRMANFISSKRSTARLSSSENASEDVSLSRQLSEPTLYSYPMDEPTCVCIECGESFLYVSELFYHKQKRCASSAPSSGGDVKVEEEVFTCVCGNAIMDGDLIHEKICPEYRKSHSLPPEPEEDVDVDATGVNSDIDCGSEPNSYRQPVESEPASDSDRDPEYVPTDKKRRKSANTWTGCRADDSDDSSEPASQSEAEEENDLTKYEKHVLTRGKGTVCVICNKVVSIRTHSTKRSAIQHVCQCVLALDAGELYTCSACTGEHFTEAEDLMHHVLNVHFKVQVTLDECGLESLNIETPETTEREDLQTILADKGEVEPHYRVIDSSKFFYECTRCGSAFRKKSMIIKHINDACTGKNRKEVCSLCNETLGTMSLSSPMNHMMFFRHVNKCKAYPSASKTEQNRFEKLLPRLSAQCVCTRWCADRKKLLGHQKHCHAYKKEVEDKKLVKIEPVDPVVEASNSDQLMEMDSVLETNEIKTEPLEANEITENPMMEVGDIKTEPVETCNNEGPGQSETGNRVIPSKCRLYPPQYYSRK